MRRAATILGMMTLCVLLSSCGQRYRSVVYNDPLYRLESFKEKKLGAEADEYVQRSDSYQDAGFFELRENESFEDFQRRMFQTLAIQSYHLEEYEKKQATEEKSVAELKEQLMQVQEENVSLRMTLTRIQTGSQVADSQADPLFQRYVIQEGDTLQSIAKGHYGKYSAWLGIYRFNFHWLRNGPNKIIAGETIFLPNFDENLFMKLHQR